MAQGSITARKGAEAGIRQPLSTHLEELARRVMWPLMVTGALSLLFFSVADTLLVWLVNHLGLEMSELSVYSPTEFLIVKLKLSVVAALVVGVPLLLWQIYLFAAPGMYANERRFALWVVPGSLVLFLLGAALALLVVAPKLMEVLLNQAEGGPAETALSLKGLFSPIITLVAGLGLAFQLPLVVGLALRLELITTEQLTGYRPYLYGLLVVLAVMLAPDPSLMAQLVVLVIMALLLELTIGGSRLLERLRGRKGRKGRKKSGENQEGKQEGKQGPAALN